MMAVILAGGKGRRLEPFTFTIPKPLLPLGDVPILEIVLRQLAGAGFSRIVLAVGHMAPLFQALLADGARFGLRLEYCLEDEPLGTAGALRRVPDPEERFLVMNGDLLTTLDYRRLVETHARERAAATVAVTARQVVIDYGVLAREADGSLRSYDEKPTLRYEVSMGVLAVSREALGAIPAAGRFDMPDFLLALKRAGKRVFCLATDCYWQDIGRFEDYQRASADFVADPARFLPREAAAP